MYKQIFPVLAFFSFFYLFHIFNMRKCLSFITKVDCQLFEKLFPFPLFVCCFEFGKKLIKNVLHTEQLLLPHRHYLLVREEKAT